MKHTSILLFAVLATTIGCSSGGGSTIHCEFDPGSTLAASSWPKFRHDVQNTGRIENTSLAPAPKPVWVFRAHTNESCTYDSPDACAALDAACQGDGENPPFEQFVASPVFSKGDKRLFIGNQNGRMYALDPSTGAKLPTDNFSFQTDFAIHSTAIAVTRGGPDDDALFFSSEGGSLFHVNKTGTTEATVWPALITGIGLGSPNITADGTVFLGSTGGIFAGFCPNGVLRFGDSFPDPVSSTPGVDRNNTIYAGSADNQVRAFNSTGRIFWAIATAAPVSTAVLIDDYDAALPTDNIVYPVDQDGHLYRIRAQGVVDYAVKVNGPVVASPALAGDHLYIAGGNELFARNKSSGAPSWGLDLGTTVHSSPAVLVDSAGKRVIVFGTDNRGLLVVEDEGTTAGTPTVIPLAGGSIVSSPAVTRDTNGNATIYVATLGGCVYAVR